ncbi:thioredoxin family protein [Clostridium sp.]|uniref:thioredoxin family protein n=1 Tax=Clostridium sp. TaxID=1506 RepID=UPI003F387B75
MFKKLVGMVLACTLIITSLTGCAGSYERDTSSGKIVEISLDDALQKVEDGDTFAVMFTQTTCNDCRKLKSIMTPYLEEHGATFFDVVLDYEGTTKEEIQNNRRKINTVFDSFDSTPSVYFVNKGKVKSELPRITTEEELDAWVVEHKLDNKE